MNEILTILVFFAFPVAGLVCKFIDEIVDEDYRISNSITTFVILAAGIYSGGVAILDDIVACVALALIIGLTLAKKVDDRRFGLLAVITLGVMFSGRLILGKPIIPSIVIPLIPLLLAGVLLDEIADKYAEKRADNRFQILTMRPILKIEALLLPFFVPQFTFFYTLGMWFFDFAYELTGKLMKRRLLSLYPVEEPVFNPRTPSLPD
ncbi:MAG: hypothetical protein ACFFBD_06535 [Candidatus Hodarchaeota archaeon]